MIRRLAVAAGFASLVFAVPALADNRDFDLVNGTGYPIKSIYIDESASPTWTDNSISSVLQDGETVRMEFGKGDKGCKWDMKVVWTDGSSSIWHDFDLCKIDKITLKYNKATDTASAVTE